MNTHPHLSCVFLILSLLCIGLAPSTSAAFPADFDGDGRNDLVVWRPSDGAWYVITSGGTTPGCFATFSSGNRLQFGLPGDKPLSADFDGDGRADATVFRPSNLTLYIKPSTWCPTTNLLAVPLSGLPAGNPIVGTDMPDEGNSYGGAISRIMFFRPPTGAGSGKWFVRDPLGQLIQYTVGNYLTQVLETPAVLSGNYQNNSPANFLGAEAASYSTGSAYFTYPNGSQVLTPAVSWNYVVFEGQQYPVGYVSGRREYDFHNPTNIWTTDKPVSGNFGGPTANLWDFVTWRPSDGTWHIIHNLGGFAPVIGWGLTNDIPIGADFDGNGLADLTVYRPSEGRWYVNIAACPPHLIDVGAANGLRICIRDWGLNGDIPLG